MKIKGIFAAVFATGLLAVLGTLWLNQADIKYAPEYTFKIVDGHSISLASLRNRPVLISFWATTCKTCIKEMPHLIELYHDFAKRGLEIIGVAMAYDPPNFVMNMRQQIQIPYPISLDIDSSAARAFGDVSLTPTSFLISPSGLVVLEHIGTLDMKLVRQQIQKMLGTQS